MMMLPGCGNVGNPLPPLVQIPSRVMDLSARQSAARVQLSFTLPKLNTDGSLASTIARVEFLRLLAAGPLPLPKGLSEVETKATVVARLSKEEMDKQGEEGKVAFSDPLSHFPQREPGISMVTYAVRVYNRKNQQAGLSNLTSLQLVPVPLPPSGLRVLAMTERFVEIQWTPPVRNADGTPFEGKCKYQVYRSTDSGKVPGELLTLAPIEGTSFQDQSMGLDATYYYSLRTIIEVPTGPVESESSTPLEARNVDRYPPATPEEVMAISDSQGVSLVWNPSSEGDLAGYLVYRREQETREIQLTDNMIPSASYVDKLVESGKTYYYRVRAVDTHGNQSEFSREISEKVP